MKKIVSLISSVAILATMSCAMFSVTASAEDKPTLKVDLVNLPETISVGSEFVLKVTCSDVPNLTGSAKPGTGIATLSMVMDLPGYGTEYTLSDAGAILADLSEYDIMLEEDATVTLLNKQLKYGFAVETAKKVAKENGVVVEVPLKIISVPEEDVVFAIDGGIDTYITTYTFDGSGVYQSETTYQYDTLNLVSATLVAPSQTAKVPAGETFKDIGDTDVNNIKANLDANVDPANLTFEKTYSNPATDLADVTSDWYMKVIYGDGKVVWSNQTIYQALKIEGIGQVEGQLHIVSNGLPEGATISFGSKAE